MQFAVGHAAGALDALDSLVRSGQRDSARTLLSSLRLDPTRREIKLALAMRLLVLHDHTVKLIFARHPRLARVGTRFALTETNSGKNGKKKMDTATPPLTTTATSTNHSRPAGRPARRRAASS